MIVTAVFPVLDLDIVGLTGNQVKLHGLLGCIGRPVLEGGPC